MKKRTSKPKFDGRQRKSVRSSSEPQAPRPVAAGPAELSYPRSWRAVVGTHAILEALNTHPTWAEALWLQQGWESSAELKKLQFDFRSKIPKIETKATPVLDRLAPSHQGAALFLNQTPKLDWPKLLAQETSRVLILDGIEDPHNLGAILRTAWLMKVDAILLPQDRATRLTATVHKVACGGVEHVPVEICAQFAKPIEELKKAGFWVFGLSHKGSQEIFDLKIPAKAAWCVGAEDKGLRSTTERLCDELVRIPQADAAASYNASVATGMALLETFRQQNIS